VTGLPLLLALLLAEAPVGVRILGPGPLRVASATPPLEGACAPLTTEEGCTLPCQPPARVELELELAGFEPRRLELGGATVPAEVDLRDSGWLPRPVTLAVDASGAGGPVTVVWLHGRETVSAQAGDGPVAGPRVAPGELVQLAVVGPATRAVTVEKRRSPAEEPIPVPLEAGSSRAVVCRDPWNGEVVAACSLTVGNLPRHLPKGLRARLLPRGRVVNLGGLQVVDTGEEGEWVLAEAEGFPPTLRRLRDLPVVADLPLDPPRELAVRLVDARSGEELAGSVSVSARLDDAVVAVAETAVEPGGQTSLLVAPGAVTVAGSAPGYRPGREDLVVERPHTAVTVRLQKAATASGRVLDGAGRPLPGAAVVALSAAGSLESQDNVAAADGTGQFTVTLAGDPPWTLVARLEGYAGSPVTLAEPARHVTIVLEPRCRVAIQPILADGTPVRGDPLMLVQAASGEVVQAVPADGDEAVGVELAPGEWVAILEERSLRGTLTLPRACQGWRGPVILLPVGQLP